MGNLSTKSLTRLSVLAACGLVNASGLYGLDAFVEKQRAISLQGVLNNIGPEGSRAPGAGAGVIIASPSKENPNCDTWTRDASLVMKMLIDEFLLGEEQLEPYIEDFVLSQAVLQTVTNPSGTFLPNGEGLGEPKYNVDLSRDNEDWGRPQHDGPALRAIALVTYSNWLVSQGQKDKAKTVVWPIISNDLSYVGQYWNSTGFEVWEEVLGSSVFTTQNQLRALVDGKALAETLGVTCTGCDQAPQVACFLNQAFWNGEFFTGNINSKEKRKGNDANTMLGSNSIFDVNAKCDDPSIQPCNSRALSSFKAWVDAFRDPALYPINEGIPQSKGIALGRYVEDVYFDGNPWYLITAGAAEFLYNAVSQWKTQGALSIDETSLGFFKDIYPAAEVKTYRSKGKQSEFPLILKTVTEYADSFVEIVEKYTPQDGSMTEQFSKIAPFNPLSATHLTWSYAAFVSMAERRASQFPPSWVSPKGSVALPEQCAPGSTKGIYAPATAAGAPDTHFGENLLVAGNTAGPGSWVPDNG
ncbi:carbohydrate-binding module family 20 protein [Astrocystis sublimbata]|nr:carbohydrate-binding module family 20 protein [Astrocystis sublimbata]